jgi:NADH:ubiquinone oxidoreductase subunit 2 (subunit N)
MQRLLIILAKVVATITFGNITGIFAQNAKRTDD